MDTADIPLARLVDRVRDARSRGVQLAIRGRGTKAFYGGQAKGEPLDVTELGGISSYEPTELVVTARAGTPLRQLEAALAEHGQCLPFEPPRFGAGGTVGGMVAAGLSGPSRARMGSVRDHVLGVTLLDGRGEVLTFGGQVTKNVAGYDVSRLMAGSWGILGVICEVSLKVLPVSPASATVGFDWEESRALRQLLEWAAHPLPITATSWYEGRLLVRLAGARAAVRAALKSLGGRELAADAAEAWWSGVRDHAGEFFSPGEAELAEGECLWRLSVPSTCGALPLPGRQLIEWGGAQRWWRTRAPVETLRSTAAAARGHATLVRAADKNGGAFAPVSDTLMRIHRGLKQAFDPAGIFNPDRLYAGL